MATKKVKKTVVKKSAVKNDVKKDGTGADEVSDNLLPMPGLPVALLNGAATRREKFLAARRNDVLVVRISSEILVYLAEEGWKIGGGAATIARKVLQSWYLKECEKANKSA